MMGRGICCGTGDWKAAITRPDESGESLRYVQTFLSASSGDFPVPVLAATSKCAGSESGAPGAGQQTKDASFRRAESGLNKYADFMRATFLVWPRLADAY